MIKRMHKWHESVAWVDIFSGDCFSGQMHRLRAANAAGSMEFSANELPQVASIIVGPTAVLKVARLGKGKAVTLSPRTIMKDATRIAGGKENVRLVVEAARE